MVRGFVAGSIGVIVLYVVVQDGPSRKLGIASNWFTTGVRHFLSPGVAGIGNHAQPSSKATLNDPTLGGSASGSHSIPV